MGFVIVEVCESNWIYDLDLESLELLYPGVSVLRTECLSKCGLCRQTPYAYVNGKIVFAKDVEACFEKIKQQIQHEFDLMDEV